jgi:hypothetical protein
MMYKIPLYLLSLLENIPLELLPSAHPLHTPVEITKTTERGGESVVTMIKQFYVCNYIVTLLQLIINIMQDINNINSKHQSHT